MADEKNTENREWSTRVGTIKAGSVEPFKTKADKDALRAIVVNAEGKENIVEAFTEAAQAKLNAAVEKGGEFVFRGPAYFSAGNESHVMIATVSERGEPRAKASAEQTDEEKAARAEASRAATAERDKTRVPVVVGSVGEGDSLTVGDQSVTVTGLGRAWKLETAEQVAGLKDRFPDVDGIEAGADVQFATFEAPEAEPAGMAM